MKLSVIVLAFCIPISAFADFGESVLLQTSSGVNLETGAVGGSGLDIVWSGTTFTLQNGAKNLSLGAVGGIQAFDTDTDATLAAYNAVRPVHCRRVLTTARAWGNLWHHDGDKRLWRNQVFRERDVHDYSYVDWLYGPTAMTPDELAPMFPQL